MARTAPAPLVYIPQNWIEWLYSIYPPDTHIHNWRAYPKRITVGASTENGDQVNLTDLFFCWAVRSYAWKTADGAAVTFPYSIHIEGPSEIQWFGDKPGVIAPLLSGDQARGSGFITDWPAPRELYRETAIQLTINNSLNAFQITAEVALWGFEVRPRSADTVITRPAAPTAGR